jgi:hypothetical protein
MQNHYSINDVIRELIKMNKEVVATSNFEDKIYFSGEFDSSQTEFETMSNQLEIAVRANAAVIGKACLRLVRYIIDKHHNTLFKTDLHDTYRHFECDYPGIRRLVYYLAYTEEQYIQSFYPNQKFEKVLSNGYSEQTIQTTLSQVDVWTIDRLELYYNQSN